MSNKETVYLVSCNIFVLLKTECCSACDHLSFFVFFLSLMWVMTWHDCHFLTEFHFIHWSLFLLMFMRLDRYSHDPPQNQRHSRVCACLSSCVFKSQRMISQYISCYIVNKLSCVNAFKQISHSPFLLLYVVLVVTDFLKQSFSSLIEKINTHQVLYNIAVLVIT